MSKARPFIFFAHNVFFYFKNTRGSLKQDEKIGIFKAINLILDTKVPYVRRNYTKTTKTRIVIREEPIKLAQYIRNKRTSFMSFSLQTFSDA